MSTRAKVLKSIKPTGGDQSMRSSQQGRSDHRTRPSRPIRPEELLGVSACAFACFAAYSDTAASFASRYLRLLPWTLEWPLAPASIFSGFSTWREPLAGGETPRNHQPQKSRVGLGLGRPRRKKTLNFWAGIEPRTSRSASQWLLTSATKTIQSRYYSGTPITRPSPGIRVRYYPLVCS